MNKQGILFQGLPVHSSQKASFLQEESSYKLNPRLSEKGETYIDITYFLLYAMCRNVICRGKVRDMKPEWEEYLLKRAEKSTYRGEYFWMCMEAEEYRCAKLILGLLEDIRNLEDDRAEKAWISFWYLLRCGFREEYAYLQKNRKTTFKEICKSAGKYINQQFMGISYICTVFLLAEDAGVKISEDEDDALLYSCAKICNQLWETEGYEIIVEYLDSLREKK